MVEEVVQLADLEVLGEDKFVLAIKLVTTNDDNDTSP